MTDIGRQDSKEELTAVAACLNEMFEVDTAPDEQAANCEGKAPAPGYRCVQACGSSAQQEVPEDLAWQWLSPSQAKSRAEFGCPVCLPADTLIATPKGDTPIRRLHTGDAVWSVDAAGQRVEVTIEHADSVPTPATHALKRLKFLDGRVVSASPGHPLADGRIFDQIAAGDRIGDAEVKTVELVPYGDKRTYDILPQGPSGLYWADGVLLKSTLFDSRADHLSKAVSKP